MHILNRYAQPGESILLYDPKDTQWSVWAGGDESETCVVDWSGYAANRVFHDIAESPTPEQEIYSRVKRLPLTPELVAACYMYCIHVADKPQRSALWYTYARRLADTLGVQHHE